MSYLLTMILKKLGNFNFHLFLEVDALINNFMLKFWASLSVFPSFPFHVPMFIRTQSLSQVYDPSDLTLPIMIPSGGILSIYQVHLVCFATKMHSTSLANLCSMK